MTGVTATGFWATVRLLLAASARRSRGRRDRQRELLNHRSDGKAADWSAFGTMFSLLMMTVLHGAAAFAVLGAVEAGQDQVVEQ